MTSTLTAIKTQPKGFDWINNTDPLERINHLSDLEKNWDGYNAPRFFEVHQSRARTLYYYFALAIDKLYLHTYSMMYKDILNSKDFGVKPFVAPCSDGSILFEWSGKRFPDKQLEILIPADENSPLEYLKSSDNFEEEGIINNFLFGEQFQKEFEELINWLFN